MIPHNPKRSLSDDLLRIHLLLQVGLSSGMLHVRSISQELCLRQSRITFPHLRRYFPLFISSASFSASMSATQGIEVSWTLGCNLWWYGLWVFLQTLACVCPGGRIGKMEISTSRSLLTPKTFPCVSTTASGSPALPMAPVQFAQSKSIYCFR